MTSHAVVVLTQIRVLGAVQKYNSNREAKSKNSRLAAVGTRYHRCLWICINNTGKVKSVAIRRSMCCISGLQIMEAENFLVLQHDWIGT